MEWFLYRQFYCWTASDYGIISQLGRFLSGSPLPLDFQDTSVGRTPQCGHPDIETPCFNN